MNIQMENKINYIVYLFFLKKIKKMNNHFFDALVQFFRLIRLNTNWKIDKLFVAHDYIIEDPEKKQILASLQFFQLVDRDLHLTMEGERYLQAQFNEFPILKDLLLQTLLLDKTGYESTCLLPSSPSSSNCGLCKNKKCSLSNQSILKETFGHFLHFPNYQHSFSKV